MNMKNQFESKQNKQVRVDPSLKEKAETKTLLKRVGLAAGGLAAAGFVASMGTGEKKAPKDLSQELSLPTKRETVHQSPDARGEFPSLSDRRVTPEQMRAIRESFAPKRMGEEKPPSAEEVAEEESLEAMSETEPIVKDAAFYREKAQMSPSDTLRFLEELKDFNVRDIKEILSLVNMNISREPGGKERLFESLSNIYALDLLSDEEFNVFVAEVVRTHPLTYLGFLRKPDLATYLPQDDKTILSALEQDPRFLLHVGSIMEEGGFDTMPKFVHEAINTTNDTLIKDIYAVFADTESKQYHKYNNEQKKVIATLLPLVRTGEMTFDEAVATIDTSPGEFGRIDYWRKIIQAEATGDLTSSELARKEVRELARFLTDGDRNPENPLSPPQDFVKNLCDEFSLQELNTIVMYAEDGGSKEGEKAYGLFLQAREKKLSEERASSRNR